MLRRLAGVLLFVAALVLLTAVSAGASPIWVMSGGLAAYDSGSPILAYGVQANSLMYPKQATQDGDWVNSLYARQDDGDFFEAGWYWTPGSTNRVWFSKLRTGGISYGESWYTVSGRPDGSRATIQVRRSGTSGDTYLVFVDGNLKRTEYATGITSCRASLGAERYDTLDYNKGSWTYTSYLSTGNVWTYWPNLLNYTGGPGMTPPDSVFQFWKNYIDRSDHYVYSDDHQN